jgi:hypothetical protein
VVGGVGLGVCRGSPEQFVAGFLDQDHPYQEFLHLSTMGNIFHTSRCRVPASKEKRWCFIN